MWTLHIATAKKNTESYFSKIPGKIIGMYKHYIDQLESFNKREAPVRKFQPHGMSELEELWKNLHDGESRSLLKKHLTPEVYKLLKDRKTKLGGTLADCIRSGKLCAH